MGFDELQLAFVAHWRIGDDEQRVAEGFQLGPAVLFQGVFDGQFVQVELALQVRPAPRRWALPGRSTQSAPACAPTRCLRRCLMLVTFLPALYTADATTRRHGCPLIPVEHGVQLGPYPAQEQPASGQLVFHAVDALLHLHPALLDQRRNVLWVMPAVAMGGSERTTVPCAGASCSGSCAWCSG